MHRAKLMVAVSAKVLINARNASPVQFVLVMIKRCVVLVHLDAQLVMLQWMNAVAMIMRIVTHQMCVLKMSNCALIVALMVVHNAQVPTCVNNVTPEMAALLMLMVLIVISALGFAAR